MEDELARLLAAVESVRAKLLTTSASLTAEQGAFQPANAWSIAEIVEHLYFAEMMGVTRLWAAADAVRGGTPWTGALPHRGKTIEQVIADTWKPREVAPPDATPRIGGPLDCWRSALASLRPVLTDLCAHLKGLPLEEIVAPHFVSGPLDARQRLEFIRYHIERHLTQVRRVLGDPSFPH